MLIRFRTSKVLIPLSLVTSNECKIPSQYIRHKGDGQKITKWEQLRQQRAIQQKSYSSARLSLTANHWMRQISWYVFFGEID